MLRVGLFLLSCLSLKTWAYQFQHYGFDQTVKPGSLLLTMLIKNEAEHLEKSLPAWGKVADYWIIGVDDNNTDASEEVIKRHLSHLPGEIVIVNFDGMGPTWTILVKHGIKHYPQATHGIISDADFMPLNTFDKRQLDYRCSKHMFTITTEDHINNRRMDWIYRNIEGARVERRTHQSVEVPNLDECPAIDNKGQPISQTLIDLVVQEHTGGYQDRTPGKQERYIGWLKADLLDFPEDGRSLYYLGMAYFDRFAATKDMEDLKTSLGYFDRRIAIPPSKASYYEERWFAILKAGEVKERYFRDYPGAREYYEMAVEADEERADAFFYLGQNYRLSGDSRSGFDQLKKAVDLKMPERSLFQWPTLYSCVVHAELMRCVPALIDSLNAEDLEVASRSGAMVQRNCGRHENQGMIQEAIQMVQGKLTQQGSARRKAVAVADSKVPADICAYNLEVLGSLQTVTEHGLEELEALMAKVKLVTKNCDQEGRDSIYEYAQKVKKQLRVARKAKMEL